MNTTTHANHDTQSTTANATEPTTLTAAEAELMTGLDAREVFRPAHESECGIVVYPRNPNMRFQLGKKCVERRVQLRIDGIRDSYEGNEQVFKLVAYGRTWWDAVRAAREKLNA